MPRKSRLQLPPLDLGEETIGERIARLRKAQGLTQTQLANKIGIIQALVSSYELDGLRLTAEMVVRFAQALSVSADELLGLHKPRHKAAAHADLSLRFTRRLHKIESLPPARQKMVLQTLDALLKGAHG